MLKPNLKSIVAIIFLFVAIVFSSCKSTANLEKVNVVDLLEPKFDVYFSIPVQENFEFSKKLFSKFISTEKEDSEKDIEKILKRIDFLYVGLDLETKEYEISAAGNFPTTLSKLVLTEKKGWKKEKFRSFTYRTHLESSVNLSMITSDIAVLSSNQQKIENQLIRYDEILSDKEDLEKISFQSSDKDIVFYFPDGNKAFSMLIPRNIKLGGIKSFRGVLSQIPNSEVFSLSIFIDSTDSRMLKATSALLRIGLMGSDAEISINEDILTISGLGIEWNSMIELANVSKSK